MMPTHDFRDYQCYVIVDDGKHEAVTFTGLKNVSIETEKSEHLQYPFHLDGEAEFTLQLTPESTRQFIAVAHGYRNYNCMRRDIRRQKRKLKEMRKRAKKEKHGTI